MRFALALLFSALALRADSRAGHAQYGDSEHRYPFHRATVQDAGGMAGAARTPAQAGALARRV